MVSVELCVSWSDDSSTTLNNSQPRLLCSRTFLLLESFSDKRRIDEAGSRYSIYWKGKPASERWLHGVLFMVRSSLVHPHNLPKVIKEQLPLCIPLLHGNFLTLISVYASNHDSCERWLLLTTKWPHVFCSIKGQTGHPLWLQCPSGERHCNMESSDQKQRPWELQWQRTSAYVLSTSFS